MRHGEFEVGEVNSQRRLITGCPDFNNALEIDLKTSLARSHSVIIPHRRIRQSGPRWSARSAASHSVANEICFHRRLLLLRRRSPASDPKYLTTPSSLLEPFGGCQA